MTEIPSVTVISLSFNFSTCIRWITVYISIFCGLLRNLHTYFNSRLIARVLVVEFSSIIFKIVSFVLIFIWWWQVSTYKILALNSHYFEFFDRIVQKFFSRDAHDLDNALHIILLHRKHKYISVYSLLLSIHWSLAKE